MDKTLRKSERAKPRKEPEVLAVKPALLKRAVSDRPYQVTTVDSLAFTGGLVALGAILGSEWGTYLGVALAVPALMVILIKVWLHLVEMAQREVRFRKGPWG